MTTLVHRGLTLVRDAAEAPASAETSAKPASRVRRFVGSDESVDSYNTVIKSDAWVLERFAKNPITQLFHNGRSFPVGIAAAKVEGKQLMVDVEFGPADDPVSGPDAEQCLRWLDRGVMAMSVGFVPLEYVYNQDRETGDPWEDLFNPPLDFTRVELCEVSIVNVPSNPAAVPVGRALRALEPQIGERFVSRLGQRSAAPVAAAEPAAPEEETIEVPDDLAAIAADVIIECINEELSAKAARSSGDLS